jgi:hypothetical protein
MAINVTNTNYSGEVLEQLLTLATTGNELVEKGLIMVIPGVHKKISIPRVHTGKMLQKRKANPQSSDSKGDFEYSEKSLDPKDFMVYTEFNPRTFENIWRPFQPKGNLVFSELPSEIQSKLLEEVTKQVQEELGENYINGTYVEDGTDEELFDGILQKMSEDDDVIIVSTAKTTMVDKLYALRSAIPKTIRKKKNLRILMSVDDFDKYDAELTARDSKNASETDVNTERFKGITIEVLTAMPDDLLVATLCSMSTDGNLFAAVNLQDDEETILVDRVSNASEYYFIKLLMKADTNIAFGEEVVVLDTRENPVFVKAAAVEEVEEG